MLKCVMCGNEKEYKDMVGYLNFVHVPVDINEEFYICKYCAKNLADMSPLGSDGIQKILDREVDNG